MEVGNWTTMDKVLEVCRRKYPQPATIRMNCPTANRWDWTRCDSAQGVSYMDRSFLDTRPTQAPLPGQLGRFKSFLEHLVLRYLIATLLALGFSAPIAILAQTSDKKVTRSDAEALAEAARLNEEVFRLYQAVRAKEGMPLAKRALTIREKVLGPDHPDTATSLNNLGKLLQGMGDLKGIKSCYERALQGHSLSRLWCK